MFTVGYFGNVVADEVPQLMADVALLKTWYDNEVPDAYYTQAAWNEIATSTDLVPIQQSVTNVQQDLTNFTYQVPTWDETLKMIYRETQLTEMSSGWHQIAHRPFPWALYVPNRAFNAIRLEGNNLLNRLWYEFFRAEPGENMTELGTTRAYWTEGMTFANGTKIPRAVNTPKSNILTCSQWMGTKWTVAFAFSFIDPVGSEACVTIRHGELMFTCSTGQSGMRVYAHGTLIGTFFEKIHWTTTGPTPNPDGPSTNRVFIGAFSVDLGNNIITYAGKMRTEQRVVRNWVRMTHTRESMDVPSTLALETSGSTGMKIDFAAWGAGTFDNGTNTITTAPISNWTTTGAMQWDLILGGHPTNYATVSDNMRIHEVRWYKDAYNSGTTTDIVYDIQDALNRRFPADNPLIWHMTEEEESSPTTTQTLIVERPT